VRTSDLDYSLPPERIAQEPAEPRDAARLLVDGGEGGRPRHTTVAHLAELLAPGDLVVLNTTRVLPARVPVRRWTGGAGEVLLVDDRGDGWWDALCRPSRKLPEGAVVDSEGGHLRFEVGEDLGGGRRLVRPEVVGTADGVGPQEMGADERRLLRALELDGQMPLPPYITTELEDPERYQTTYSRRPASAAAPTAGLHITEGLLADLHRAGVSVATVDLVVGYDTFRPVTTEHVEDHPIHSEHYAVPEATWHDITTTRMSDGRVVAVGTTTVRALESVAHTGHLAGRTDLFITPGFDFRVVDALVTNFHLPRSSLLAMVEAFVGPRWRDLYQVAAEERYRFLSFGDAMLLQRSAGRAPTP
jgi:S-adenosylmethionine:tRNA ribosyltransferase-isomerase